MNAALPQPLPAFQAASSGRHILADLHGIDPARLRDCAAIDTMLREAALQAGARILHSHMHSFGSGQGVTGVVLLAESHISIHTWPETGFAAIDIFMCGNAEPERALAHLQAGLHPQDSAVRVLERGTQGL